MKKQYKSSRIKNHKITKKNDGVSLKGYVVPLKLFLDLAPEKKKY